MNRVAPHGVIFGLSAGAWLIAAPAVAQRSPDWERCGADSTPPDQRIAACTAIVGSLGEPPANVAMAYCNRGIAYQSGASRRSLGWTHRDRASNKMKHWHHS